MKNVKREMKRKGFTLVELLIVIVVIGVLSAMMMLSSTEAVSSAKASDIVSDLRNMKTAALAWYADHLDIMEERVTPTSLTWGETGIAHATVRTDILKYMNNENADAKYKFIGKDTGTWFVYCTSVDSTVGKKLQGRAKSVGLFKTNSSKDADVYDASGSVYMYIR